MRRALPRRILVPVVNPATARDLIQLGASLLVDADGELTALGVVEVPEGMPLSEGAIQARSARRLLQRVQEYAPEGVSIRPIVRIGRQAAEGIAEAITEQEIELAIFGWAGGPPTAGPHRSRPGRRRREPVRPWVFSPTVDEVVRAGLCDVAVVKARNLGAIRRILVPVRGGPQAELALLYADAIARRHDAVVAVLHLLPPRATPAVRQQAELALAAVARQHVTGRVETVLRDASNVRSAILAESELADILIMGASTPDEAAPGMSHLIGELPEWVASRTSVSVIVVKSRETLTTQAFEERSLSPETLEAADRAAEQVRSVPGQVERWFGESNYHHAEFDDLDRLLRLKQQRGITVSLVLPTLNESATIGPIVRAARTELMERVPLIDELLVIDSVSSDDTVAIAESEGARVVVHPDVLARYGSFRGKGEALWKSLYETSGDVIIWADTDVTDWHPRMAYGTLGPLLEEPRLQYVKGYYQRPIVHGGVITEGGGGRVTELVARPLINLFYPELSGLIQPLAGEYAGRRSLLESIPFFTGYGVEIGHLIDIADRVGLDGLGQVDLERRVHRNQDLEGLSRMSFVILQAVARRLEERRRSRSSSELGSTMMLPRYSDGALGLEVIELADRERPPMIRIPEYLERRAATGAAAEQPLGSHRVGS